MSTDQLTGRDAGRAVARALGDPTRLSIVELLGPGPRPVGALAADLPVTRSAVSQHLRVLKDAGLVTDRREGNRSWYRLDPAGVAHLHRYLDDLWGRALEGFKAAVEQPEEGP